jgi:putative transposase
MSFNPSIHHRKSIRLKNFDYTNAGMIFITLCTHERMSLFGKIINGKLQASTFGDIAKTQWQNISNRWASITVDEFIVMPNHIHGILQFNTKTTVGAPLAGALDSETGAPNPNENTQIKTNTDDSNRATVNNRATARVAPTTAEPENPVGAPLVGAQTNDNTQNIMNTPTVGAVIGGYKSLVFNACLAHAKQHGQQLGAFWQRNYWERVIRDEAELQNIREYIQNNPASWEMDVLFVGEAV